MSNIFNLPEKLSDCIELALDDMAKVMKDDRYIVDFKNWHKPLPDKVGQFGESLTKRLCSVCFAGSIMAKSFELDRHRTYDPEEFEDYNICRLIALDSVRSGDFTNAFLYMDISSNQAYEEIKRINVNQRNYPEFVEAMKDITKVLRKYSL